MDHFNMKPKHVQQGILSFLILLIFSLESFVAQGQMADGNSYYDQGRREYSVNKYEYAILSFNQAIKAYRQAKSLKKDENISRCYNFLGYCYFNTGRYEKALECGDLAIQHDSTEKNNYYLKGEVYFQTLKYKKAIQEFERSQKTKGQDTKAVAYLGMIYTEFELWDQAQYYFDKALSAQSQDQLFLFALGQMHMRKRRTANQAKRAFTVADNTYKDFYIARIFKGYALACMGKGEKGRYLMEKVVEDSELDITAWNFIGFTYKLEGNKQKELESLKKALECEPFTFQDYRDLSLAHMKLGQYEEAIEAVNIGISMDSCNYRLLADRGYIHLWFKKYQLAKNDIVAFLEEGYGTPRILADLGMAEYYLGELENAQTHFDRAIEFNKDNPDYFYGRGLVRAALKTKGAKEDFKEALRILKEDPPCETKLTMDLVEQELRKL